MSVLLISPDTKEPQRIKVGPRELCTRDEWFPQSKTPDGLDRFKSYKVFVGEPETDDWDSEYFVCFYDGHNGGKRNENISPFLCENLGVAPTGNFLFARKKLVNGKEINMENEMELLYIELMNLFNSDAIQVKHLGVKRSQAHLVSEEGRFTTLMNYYRAFKEDTEDTEEKKTKLTKYNFVPEKPHSCDTKKWCSPKAGTIDINKILENLEYNIENVDLDKGTLEYSKKTNEKKQTKKTN
jgi:hypothetical protein